MGLWAKRPIFLTWYPVNLFGDALIDAIDADMLPRINAIEQRNTCDSALLQRVARTMSQLEIVWHVPMRAVRWVPKRDDMVDRWRSRVVAAMSCIDWFHAQLAHPSIAFGYYWQANFLPVHPWKSHSLGARLMPWTDRYSCFAHSLLATDTRPPSVRAFPLTAACLAKRQPPPATHTVPTQQRERTPAVAARRQRPLHHERHDLFQFLPHPPLPVHRCPLMLGDSHEPLALPHAGLGPVGPASMNPPAPVRTEKPLGVSSLPALAEDLTALDAGNLLCGKLFLTAGGAVFPPRISNKGHTTVGARVARAGSTHRPGLRVLVLAVLADRDRPASLQTQPGDHAAVAACWNLAAGGGLSAHHAPLFRRTAKTSVEFGAAFLARARPLRLGILAAHVTSMMEVDPQSSITTRPAFAAPPSSSDHGTTRTAPGGSPLRQSHPLRAARCDRRGQPARMRHASRRDIGRRRGRGSPSVALASPLRRSGLAPS